MADDLDPQLSRNLQAFQVAMEKAGHPVRVTSGRRDAKKQQELFNQGKTPVDGVKKISKHQTGHAFDIGFQGKENWDLVGQLAPQHGLEWGGNWNTPDKVHLQMAQQPQTAAGAYEIEGEGVFSDDMGSYELEDAAPAPQNLAAAVPEPPQGKSFGGFVGNVVKDTGQVIGDTAKGLLFDLPRATANLGVNIGDAIKNPTTIPDKFKSAGDLAVRAGQGLWDHFSGYATDPLDKIYERPVQALTDLGTVAGIGAGATKMAGMSRTANALSKVEAATNIPGKVVSGTAKSVKFAGKPFEKTAELKSRFGARGRNQEYMDRTVNPKAISRQSLMETGGDVQTDILQSKASTFRDLESRYDEILGPKGGQEIAFGIPDPPNLNPDPPNLLRGRTAAARTTGAPRPTASSAVGPDTFLSTDTPFATARPVTMQKGREVRHGGFVAQAEYPQTGPTVRSLHEMRGKVDPKTLPQIDSQIRAAAKRMGLTKEAEEYFTTAGKWNEAHKKFENRFIKSVLDKPEEAIAGLFDGKNQKTYQPPGTKSIYAGGQARVYNNKELIGQLKDIVRPETFEKLQAKLGDDLRRKVTDASGNIDHKSLHQQLERFEKAGLDEALLPNHKALKDVAKVLSEHADKMSSGYYTMPGSKGFVRDLLHTALKKTGQMDIDIERAVKKLNRPPSILEGKLIKALKKGARGAELMSTIDIPEPPTEGLSDGR